MDDEGMAHGDQLADFRRALRRLREDPPVGLAASPLLDLPIVAIRAGEPSTPLRRAQALRGVLLDALERLKPGEAEAGDERSWRPYRILSEEYVRGRDHEEVAADLTVSRRAYFREKERAIRALAAAVFELAAEGTASLVEPPPTVAHLAGRQAELEALSRRLEREGAVVIGGLAGSGKTTLAAHLAAAQAPDWKPIWIAIKPGLNADLDGLLEALALRLSAEGRDTYQRFLRTERGGPGRHGVETQVAYLASTLAERRYVICLDDVHLAEEDARVTLLLDRLCDLARHGALRLIVTSRQTPAFARGLYVETIRGLDRAATAIVLEQAGLAPLPGDLLDLLHTKTEGYPVFLNLFVAWMRGRGLEAPASATDRARVRAFVANLERAQDVRNYLLANVEATLSAEELRVARVAAAFRRPFDPEREPVAALLAQAAGGDPGPALDGLVNKHLASRREDGTLALHTLVREHFAARLRLRPTEYAHAHSHAAAYYEHDERDPTEAAYHYREAGETQRAGQALIANLAGLIGSGRGAVARELLDQLVPDLAGDALEARALVALGDLEELAGRYDAAAAAYRRALPLLSGDDRVERAAVHRRLADALAKREDYLAALDVLAAAPVPAGDGAEERFEAARLANATGHIHKLRGDLAAAREQYDRALALLEGLQGPAAVEERAAVLRNLGNLCVLVGQPRQALEYLSRSVALADLGPNRVAAARAHNDFGALLFYQGRYREARSSLERALRLSEEIGFVYGQAMASSNLAQLNAIEGSFEQAIEWCERSLAISRSMGSLVGEAVALNNLGHVLLAAGNPAGAVERLESVLALARRGTAIWFLPETLRLLAEARLALGQASAARDLASEALRQARQRGLPEMAGAAERVLGDAAARLGEPDAVAHLRRAVEVLEPLGERLELARALRSLGRLLIERGRAGEGAGLLERASLLFGEVGATWELRGTGPEASAPVKRPSLPGRNGRRGPRDRLPAGASAPSTIWHGGAPSSAG